MKSPELNPGKENNAAQPQQNLGKAEKSAAEAMQEAQSPETKPAHLDAFVEDLRLGGF